MFGEKSGGENPVGQRVSLDGGQSWSLVMGVAADAKNNGIEIPADPEYWRLRMNDSLQIGRGSMAIFRTSQDPAAIERSIREEITALDPAIPVTMETLEARVDRFRERPRFTAALVSLFAVFGWILAAVGLYGVLSFLVSRRTREIGVRMALGATPAKITALIQRQAFAMVAAGLAVGLIAAAALTRLIRGLLFEISPRIQFPSDWQFSLSSPPPGLRHGFRPAEPPRSIPRSRCASNDKPMWR